MIVSKKALIAAAVIPIIIALAIAIPKISPGTQTGTSAPSEMRIQFVAEDMKRVSFGVTETIGAKKSETLIINNDGSALYNVNVEGEKGSQSRFQVDALQLKRIKALLLETGFMQIPNERFDARENATEFTRYTLTVNLNGSTKTIEWVDEPSAKDFVPALLYMIGDTILGTIQDRK